MTCCDGQPIPRCFLPGADDLSSKRRARAFLKPDLRRCIVNAVECRRWCIFVFVALRSIILSTAAVAANGFYVCAAHISDADWDDEFSRGPITIPAGTVFDFAGHIIGHDLQDPNDARRDMSTLSALELKERFDRIGIDMTIDRKNTRGIILNEQALLTSKQPCTLAKASVALSQVWGWTVNQISQDYQVFFTAYGVVKRDALVAGFDDDGPFEHAATHHEINGSVKGVLTTVVDLDEKAREAPPDETPVLGSGNSACWDDEKRQDIACRAITERLLLSLRGSTRKQVQDAMNVKGGSTQLGLHFTRNYSRGEKTGSGNVNFGFGSADKVVEIDAMVERANDEGQEIMFQWNAIFLPAGCSDYPNSSLAPCRR